MVHTRNKGAVETVNFARRPCSNNVGDWFLAVKVMNTVFRDLLGLIYTHYLKKGKKVTKLYYAEFLGGLGGESQKNSSIWKIKCAITPWKRTSSHLYLFQDQIGQIGLRTGAQSTVLVKFGPVSLFVFSNLNRHSLGRYLSGVRRSSLPWRRTL